MSGRMSPLLPTKRRRLLLALAAWPLAGRASIQAPPEVHKYLGSEARLRGAARLRWLGLSVYNARLWVGERFEPEQFERRSLALELIYARALKGPLIAERSLDEMRRGPPMADDQAQRWLDFMKQTFPDVREGDRITGIWLPDDQRSAFYVNGTPAQVLRDPGFGPRFFGIWLAPHTSQPALRQQLLGISS
jgi:Chalcone isomerase-like